MGAAVRDFRRSRPHGVAAGRAALTSVAGGTRPGLIQRPRIDLRTRGDIIQTLVADTGKNDDRRRRWRIPISGRRTPPYNTLRLEKQNLAHGLLLLLAKGAAPGARDLLADDDGPATPRGLLAVTGFSFRRRTVCDYVHIAARTHALRLDACSRATALPSGRPSRPSGKTAALRPVSCGSLHGLRFPDHPGPAQARRGRNS
jgi:hypothetical protein